MITKDTHRVDWNKTAQITGVVLLVLTKATWWLGKHAGLILMAIVTVIAKVFVAILSVSASTSTSNDDDDIREIQSCDENGCDLNTGLPIRNRF